MTVPKQSLFLLATILFAAFLRIWGLSVQSLWYDELYTMVVSDPFHSFHDILTDLKSDFHPPLHYFLANLWFKAAGYSDVSGRLLSALIGIGGIAAMYGLGRQMQSMRSGLLLALLTSVNFYHIYHSQEVRMYILLFLLSALSALYLLIAIDSGRKLHYSLFVLSTSLLLYTHYFGLFVFAAEGLLLLHLTMRKPGPGFIRKGLISFLIIGVLFLPWLPYLFVAGKQAHWMGIPEPAFFFVYLYDYSGKDPLSTLLYLLGLIFFGRMIFRKYKSKSEQISPAMLLILYSLFSIYILSFFVSFFKPVLQLRCTFAAMPFLFAAVVMGLDTLKAKLTNTLFAILVISALINIILIKKYYWTMTKENYRDITAIVVNASHADVILSRYARVFNYYFSQHYASQKVMDPLGMDPDSLLGNAGSLIVLNAHNHENIMTMEEYNNLSVYIKNNFLTDTIYSLPDSKTENAVVYLRK